MTSELATTDQEPRYPAIPGLTDLQAAFVHEYLANPKSKQAAAVRAGYSPRSAHVTASRLLANPLIAEALMQGTRVLLASASAEALGVQLQLMRSAKSELVREKAASSVLDRSFSTDGRGGGAAVHIHFDFGEGDER